MFRAFIVVIVLGLLINAWISKPQPIPELPYPILDLNIPSKNSSFVSEPEYTIEYTDTWTACELDPDICKDYVEDNF